MKRKKDDKDESPEEAEKEIEEEAEEEAVEAMEEMTEDDEAKQFAFPMAPIVRLMRDELDNDKMIRSRVKAGMNLWLEKICRKIAVKMNESDYTMVSLDDFKTAIEPYELVEDVEQERHRIVASLEKIKQDCDSLIRDVNRKFISYTIPVVRYGEEEIEEDESVEESAEEKESKA